jgi:Protein of unknown function (DUF3040)
MALSMEEQRILAEIEEQLTRAEPALAARLAAFRSPRLGIAPRSPRARFAVSVAALTSVLLISVLLYAFAALRAMPDRHPGGRSGSPPRPVLTRTGARSAARQGSSVRASQLSSRATAAADTARARRGRGGPAGTGR